MFNSETLEVAAGMVFLFLLVSLICTGVKEWLEGIFKWRAMDLERALRTLLDDHGGELTAQLLRHPLLYSLFPGAYDPTGLRTSWLTPGQGARHMRLSRRRGLPSYIPAAQFANALLDCVARGPLETNVAGTPAAPAGELERQPLTVELLRDGALALASPHLRRAVLAALDHAGGDLSRARQNVEAWFNGTMDRASGWYKRRTQAVLFALGIGIAASLNLDAIHVMSRLAVDQALRGIVVQQATRAEATLPLADARRTLDQLGLPIGWSHRAGGLPVPRQLCADPASLLCERTAWWGVDWWKVLCGWLLTAFATMLGAPFWFDLLNKVMVIRSTVKPHEKSPEEASEDRQPAAKEKA